MFFDILYIYIINLKIYDEGNHVRIKQMYKPLIINISIQGSHQETQQNPQPSRFFTTHFGAQNDTAIKHFLLYYGSG